MANSAPSLGGRNNRQLRKYLLAGGAVALVGTLAYRAYQTDAYGRSKSYLSKLRAALQQYTDAVATGGDICATIMRDLRQFLQSDGDEVPSSLRQVSKLLQSEEFTSTASSTVAAIYEGVAGERMPFYAPIGVFHPSQSLVSFHSLFIFSRSFHSAARSQPGEGQQDQPSAIDKILDALLSDRGHSLVSVAVSMGAKNLVSAYVEASSRAAAANANGVPQADSTDKTLSFLSTPEGQQLAVMAVAAFASNGMRVYMDKSLEVNFYEDLFTSLAKPQHLEAAKQCIGVFARNVVASYMRGGVSADSAAEMRQAARSASNSRLQVTHEADGELLEGGNASAAVSLAPESPSESLGNGSGGASKLDSGAPVLRQIEALRGASFADDLDSDSLLHARKTLESAKIGSGQGANTEWISAVGKEWLNVSKDKDGRKAVADVVGTVTREAVAGVSGAVLDRFSTALLLMVLLTGVLMAVVFRRVMGTVIGVA